MCDVLVSVIQGFFFFFSLISKVNICSGAAFFYYFVIIYKVLSSLNLVGIAGVQLLTSDVQLALSEAQQNACAEF